MRIMITRGTKVNYQEFTDRDYSSRYQTPNRDTSQVESATSEVSI